MTRGGWSRTMTKEKGLAFATFPSVKMVILC